SLRTLRGVPRTPAADREPLIGFGDPLLQGGSGRRRGGAVRSQGLPVALEDIRGLDRLPGTRAELLGVPPALGADAPRAVLRGPARLGSRGTVADRATQALMTEIFQRYAAEPGLARAEALRLGMLAILDHARGNTAYFAHPFAWAPFFLVGEGGAPPAGG